MNRWSLALMLVVVAATGARAGIKWNEVLQQPGGWYATPEARSVAEHVLQFQTESGGWPKNVDMTAAPSAEFLASTAFDHRHATIDNNATTTQIQLLARVNTATPDPRFAAAVTRALDYLLDAQYPSGGWPQYFPLITGYYTHITYNDDAMVNVLSVLRDVSSGEPPYAFTEARQRERAKVAVQRGIDCILRTQVRQNGKLTVWCAQHDENTFAPAWARNFEPPSLSGNESVGLVRFLMRVDNPTPEIRAAITSAVEWFQQSAVPHLRIDNTVGADGKKDRHAVPDPAAPHLWARFYELGTNRPIFLGRDRVIHYDFNEIERERRTGYNYLGTWPERLLDKEYPRWTAQHPTS
ncbi:MAG: pectate lyase [Opitutus sp.]